VPGHVLERVTPFRFLPREARARLAADLAPLPFARGDVLARAGDAADRRVLLLARGSVEVLDVSRRDGQRVNVIQAGHYFGERASLFDEPRRHEVRGLEDGECLVLSGERFLTLVAESPPFAQALARILREKHRIFEPLERFLAEVEAGIARGEIGLRQLLPLYAASAPALHPWLGDPARVDWGALSYAVRRLPANATATLAWFLTDDMPEHYARLARQLPEIPTEARPRTVLELVPGKSMVLLRDGLSDLLDLVTCLCTLAVEARKLRRRVTARGSLHELVGPAERPVPAGDAPAARLARAGFGPAEVDALASVWGAGAPARLRELALHHEDFGLTVRKQAENMNARHSELWIEQIAAAARELLGADPADFAPEIGVHVISSNTHSVSNCLSPFLAEERAAIARWGRAAADPLAGADWSVESDLAYALARGYFAVHPTRAAARARADGEAGLLHLASTAFTGIQVDLVDLSRLAGRPLDNGIPALAAGGPASRDLLVNIDFAFGHQAEQVVHGLLALFGRNLRSLNVLGKAGALVGRRGDVLVPTAFVEQRQDAVLELERQDVDLARLAARLPGRELHRGPMLTVVGTLLQNRTLLRYYRELWRCVGLEMEGWWYYRALADARRAGELTRDVALRFLYYVSDAPLESGDTLAERLGAAEGIPPLYAITREILSGILGAARPPASPASTGARADATIRVRDPRA
jgi:CRP-like cAMP-binding protein